MRRICVLLLMSLLFFPAMMAQENESMKRAQKFKEVREFKMKFLAKEMDLDDARKQEFFKLYEEMCRKRDEVYKPVVEQERKIKKEGEEATDEDYQKLNEARSKANAEVAEIEMAYNEKFAEFLSQKQIFKLREAEQNYRSRLEEMKHNRKKNPDKQKNHKK